ncbi:hypothetical protein OCS_04834 [Ophiocordyceps sinensis CO18]|uniref:Uncharacterized protein n=1 Tax=Ophiocordyceps sinensis (strain Co18 / CGMCC 3.14243) TaxID=911162 RepID=T5AAK3_OPHSC|nr:hypothetical protein OCS_04834 [Ophiocordyceps sinensis CO18]
MSSGKSKSRSRGGSKMHRAILDLLGWTDRDMHAANPDEFTVTLRTRETHHVKGAGARFDETKLRIKMQAMMLVVDEAAERNLKKARARARNQTEAEAAQQLIRHETRKRSAKHAIESLKPDEVEQTSLLLAEAARTMVAERAETVNVFDYLEPGVFEYLEEDSPNAQEQIRKLSDKIRKVDAQRGPLSLSGLVQVLEDPMEVGSGEQGVGAAARA